MTEPGHKPVMPREIVEYLRGASAGTVVDGTAGGGGHTALLSSEFPGSPVLAFERDPQAAEALRERFTGSNVRVFTGSYTRIPRVVDENGLPPATAALFDLGLSSIQLDDPDRGFSHRADGPLDMRFDTSLGEPVSALLKKLTEKQIADIIYRFGEEGRSRVIAREIKKTGGPATTGELAAAVKAAVRGNPVKPLSRVFQAFRIHANRELEHLETLLGEMHSWTAPGCRIAVLTFHSLEDRMIKLHFRDDPRFTQFDPPWLLPSREEKRENGRARSARLRLGVRL